MMYPVPFIWQQNVVEPMQVDAPTEDNDNAEEEPYIVENPTLVRKIRITFLKRFPCKVKRTQSFYRIFLTFRIWRCTPTAIPDLQNYIDLYISPIIVHR